MPLSNIDILSFCNKKHIVLPWRSCIIGNKVHDNSTIHETKQEEQLIDTNEFTQTQMVTTSSSDTPNFNKKFCLREGYENSSFSAKRRLVDQCHEPFRKVAIEHGQTKSSDIGCLLRDSSKRFEGPNNALDLEDLKKLSRERKRMILRDLCIINKSDTPKLGVVKFLARYDSEVKDLMKVSRAELPPRKKRSDAVDGNLIDS
jgi:hypothetical protein